MNDSKRKLMEPKLQKRRERNPREVLNRGISWKPMCFQSRDQYKDWIHLMRQSPRPRDTGYCYDCTPEFKAEMMECGRCEHPETRFVLRKNPTEGEVELVGISSESMFWKRVQRGGTILNWGNKDDQEVPITLTDDLFGDEEDAD